MSLHSTTKQNPPKLVVKKDSKEVVFDLVSCMCDNAYRIQFKKNASGEFKCWTFGQHFSNFQIKNIDAIDLEWLADEGKWQEIIDAINSGTKLVHNVKQR